MRVDIFLRFTTKPGQNLKIFGNIPQLGNGNSIHAVPMQYVNLNYWHIGLNLDGDISTYPGLNYQFMLSEHDGIQIQDWGKHRNVDLKHYKQDIAIVETWNYMGAVENNFYTIPFQNIFFQSKQNFTSIDELTSKVRFTAIIPTLAENELLLLTGNVKELGNWSTSKSIQMQFDGKQWIADINLDSYFSLLEYKYAVLNKETGAVTFEEGSNRNFRHIPDIKEKLLVNDCYVRLPSTHWKGAGVAIPVFSLRSENGLGVGEFTDIKKMVDWAEEVSVKMIQILPVNDTTNTHTFLDSYPYAAISAFALHPLYLDLNEVAGNEHIKLIKHIMCKRDELNALKEVDYEEVMKLKWEAISLLFQKMHKNDFKTESYNEFFCQNKYWLVPYAAYSYLREKNGSSKTSEWGRYSIFNQALIEELTKEKSKNWNDIAIYYFIQYHLHIQLKQAHHYANQKGIILKGDIAIGVHRDGVDAWMQPEIYNLNMQAGAPPDDFAISGQNWGFPTYNWMKMKSDGYEWWQQRFRQMSNYFDAFRIDHILGFFRIWSIPSHAVEGIMGYFVPAIPVHMNEFAERNIWFDADRFTQPFITDEVIWEMAGVHTQKVHHFLDRFDSLYVFKEEFNTQRKIESYFNALEETEHQNELKQILFNLHSNVILWRDHTSHELFHFRFNAAQTLSFKYLDDHSKHQLWELYVDYYFKRQDHIWKEEALEKLPALKRSTDMLICGEDLGLVPECVPGVMSGLGFLSMEVQRMPKKLDVTFFNPADAPYLSVVTPSTHDMSTIREWWEEDREKSQNFYNELMGQYGSAPSFAEPHIVKSIILQHLWSPAMWSIFQMQDLFAMNFDLRVDNPAEERINIPGNPKHYWRYRMNITIEELISKNSFNMELKEYILQSGR